MSKDRLDITDHFTHGRSWHVAWFLPDEGDFGSVLGESGHAKDETGVAARAVKAMTEGTDDHGFYWSSKSSALAALRVARAALKAHASKRPLPDWATKALAAGWKAPKGWTP